jgi:hypothetical protein
LHRRPSCARRLDVWADDDEAPAPPAVRHGASISIRTGPPRFRQGPAFDFNFDFDPDGTPPASDEGRLSIFDFDFDSDPDGTHRFRQGLAFDFDFDPDGTPRFKQGSAFDFDLDFDFDPDGTPRFRQGQHSILISISIDSDPDGAPPLQTRTEETNRSVKIRRMSPTHQFTAQHHADRRLVFYGHPFAQAAWRSYPQSRRSLDCTPRQPRAIPIFLIGISPPVFV